MTEEKKKQISDKLKAAIKKSGLKKQDVAKILGVKPPYVSMICNPKTWHCCSVEGWQGAERWFDSGLSIREYGADIKIDKPEVKDKPVPKRRKRNPKYSQEFKREVVDYYVETKGSMREVEKKYGVRNPIVYKWMKEFGVKPAGNLGPRKKTEVKYKPEKPAPKQETQEKTKENLPEVAKEEFTQETYLDVAFRMIGFGFTDSQIRIIKDVTDVVRQKKGRTTINDIVPIYVQHTGTPLDQIDVMVTSEK